MENTLPNTIKTELESGRRALFVLNHSGGKDSQAMTILVERTLRAWPNAIAVMVHANLPEVDWPGIEQHIRSNHPGLRLEICTARWQDGSEKRLLDMVERRGMWPSSQQRYCTSDLKRGPIGVVIRGLAKELGVDLVINCSGERHAESDDRAKLVELEIDERLSVNKRFQRTVYRWRPILTLTEADVRQVVADAGQKLHPAYDAGMSRLSCCFCIMAKKADLLTAARLQPELARRYGALERKIGHTMKQPAAGEAKVYLDELLAFAAQPKAPAAPVQLTLI
jgi:DNA sulfur modification protein DndC